jgi:intracellular sulfur oxidation DsrE/DsrF family protein
MSPMRKLLTILLMLLAWPAWATSSDDTIEEILARQTAPAGVVFDVDEWDIDALKWGIPLIRDYVDRLRERFPEIEIAVVSHGDEEFALLKRARENYRSVHQGVEALVNDQIPVHICAGHAIMNGYSESGFVDYVERVSSGVDTVADYRMRGFVHIPVEQPR